MHYLFEIQLMTHQIVGKATTEKRADYAWKVKVQHVSRYRVNDYRENAVLPTGRRYLGMTRPLNLEVGMIDLGAIRQKIRADYETWNGMNREGPEDFEDVTDYPTRRETEAGISEQATGGNQTR